MKFCSDMCQYSNLFQNMVKKSNSDELCEWFHNFLKITINDNVHKDCEKRIQNLKNMIKAVSGNSSISINDMEYSRMIKNKKKLE
jgi:hypothetical protein